MIAKLINGTISKCPNSGQDGKGIFHTNLPLFYERHLDEAAVDGYYMVVYTEKPGDNYKASWTMQTYLERMCIVQLWTSYTPEPEPEDPISARLDMIEECILEMSEIIYA